MFYAKGFKFAWVQQLAGASVVGPVSRDKRRAVGPHQPCDVHAGDASFSEIFKRAQHRFVVEGAALNHDFLRQHVELLKLNHLIQRVFDDRVRKTGGNIGNRRAFLLRLFDL